MIDNHTEKYLYPWFLKIPVFLGVILSTIPMFWIIIILAPYLADWIRGKLVNITSIIIGLGVGITVFGFLTAYFSNMLPNIQVLDQGLKVQVFLFWWVFVPWGDVQDIRPRFGGLSRSRLVVVRKLTPIHRLIGGSHTGFKPAFIIKPTLDRFDELIRVIKHNISQF